MIKAIGKSFAFAIVTLCGASGVQAAPIIFDSFSATEGLGHFNQALNSPSNLNVNGTSSSNARIGTDGVDSPVGANQLSIVPTTAGATALRLRHVSGGGTPGNNVPFTTSAGVDGWIGMYLKTTSPGYTVSLWIEGPSNNAGIEKTVLADGAWHLYEWNLDDNSGGLNGWGTVTGITGGQATVDNGSHTIDSVIFRNAASASGTILMDFVAKSDSGSIAALVPEPASLSLVGLGALGLLGRRRRA